MPIVSEYARRFGVYDDLPPLLSMALGAGETTLVRLTTAYCMFVNGGRKINYTFIDRIQDRLGQTIWRHDGRTSEGCTATAWKGQDEPQLGDDRRQIIDPMTAYQITSMLEGVVVRGTGSLIGSAWANRSAARPAPLTRKRMPGSSDSRLIWRWAFSWLRQSSTHGSWRNRRRVGGADLADFFKMALKDKPAVPFRTPPDIGRCASTRELASAQTRTIPTRSRSISSRVRSRRKGYTVASDYQSQEHRARYEGNGRGASSSAPPWGGGEPQPRQPAPDPYQSPYGREPRPGGLY